MDKAISRDLQPSLSFEEEQKMKRGSLLLFLPALAKPLRQKQDKGRKLSPYLILLGGTSGKYGSGVLLDLAQNCEPKKKI
jgi:hypothetical protein